MSIRKAGHLAGCFFPYLSQWYPQCWQVQMVL